MYTVNENPKGLTEYSSFSQDFVLNEPFKPSKSQISIGFYNNSTKNNDIFRGVSNNEESIFTKHMKNIFDN